MTFQRIDGKGNALPDQPGSEAQPALGMPSVSTDENRDVESMLEFDPDTINPEYHYRFVNTNKANVARKRARGYEFVRPDEGVRVLGGELDNFGDNTVGIADTVLMKVKNSIYHGRRKKIAQVGEERLSGEAQQRKQFEAAVKKAAKKIGLPIKVLGPDSED